MASKTLLRLNAQKLQLLNLATDTGVVVNNAIVVATLTDIDGTVVPELNGVTLSSIDTNGNYSYTIPATFSPASRDDYLCLITASVGGVLMMTLNQSISVSDRTDLSSTSVASGSVSGRVLLSDLIPFIITPAGTVPLANAKFIALYLNNTGSTGNVDLLDSATGLAYVVPTGKVAIVSSGSVYNSNASQSVDYFAIKVASNYYRVANSATMSLNGSGLSSMGLLLNAGEGLAINATQTSQNAFARVLEFDAASGLKQGRILSLAFGDNTLYTAPDGKTACILSTSFGAVDGLNTGVVFLCNDTASSPTYIINVVRRNGSPGTTNRAIAPTAITAHTRQSLQFNAGLAAGDFININTTGGTETAWVMVVEI
jgi:hypothetical protein